MRNQEEDCSIQTMFPDKWDTRLAAKRRRKTQDPAKTSLVEHDEQDAPKIVSASLSEEDKRNCHCISNHAQPQHHDGGPCHTYNFILYSAADELSTALQFELGTSYAALAAPTLLFLSPVPVYKAVMQIAVVAILTDLVIGSLQSATRIDPIPGLGGVLVLMEMLLQLFE